MNSSINYLILSNYIKLKYSYENNFIFTSYINHLPLTIIDTPMLFSEQTYKFMYAALVEAERAFEENEVPIGAVVVHKNKIIGKGYNQVERLKDPTAHAEMLAITAAANNLQDWRLNECDLYVNLEPCVMCTGAAISARIRNIYFSVYEPKFGACGSLYNIAEEGKLNHKIGIYTGIYADESNRLLKEFFSKTRIKEQK